MIAFGVAAVIAASDGLGPWALVIGYYAAAVTDVLLSWVLVRWRPQPGLASFAMWKELIGYARHVLASNVVLRLGEQVPTLLIGRYVGTAPLGQYRYADRIAGTPFIFILSAASSVILPAFSRISHERERFAAAFLTALRWFSALTMPLALILVPMGISLAVVAFGEVWRDAGEASMALAPFVVGAALINLVSEALKAEGRPEILIRIHTVTVIAGAAAMIAMLGWELVGVAAGVSVGALRWGRLFAGPNRSVLLTYPVAASSPSSGPRRGRRRMAGLMLPLDRLSWTHRPWDRRRRAVAGGRGAGRDPHLWHPARPARPRHDPEAPRADCDGAPTWAARAVPDPAPLRGSGRQGSG